MPITSAIVGFASAAVCKKAIESVVSDLYTASKGKVSTQISTWRSKARINDLYQKLKAVRFVKTLWQVEKDVDLSKFYYPSRVIDDKHRKQINDIDDFGSSRNVLIQGTVGQGKSIFFRYLVSREMAYGKIIPLFLELRRIEKGDELSKYISKGLDALGIKANSQTLDFLFTTGRILLFLDAFDEVKESERTALLTEIQHLITKYDNLRVFLSSRPGTGVEAIPGFDVFLLAPLIDDEYKDVVARMVHDAKATTEIIKGVEKQAGIKQLLVTPLLVALLVFRYRVDQSIPENEMAFYGDLFRLLLQRHDKLKAGYIRPRKSGLSDGDLEDVFNAVCFILRKNDHGAPKQHELRKCVREATGTLNVACDADSVIHDIVHITCLLLEEGGEYQFIHKSVQEFHAACFVRNETEVNAASFYAAMLKRWKAWQQEVSFLSRMDGYRFDKFFRAPEMIEALGLNPTDDLGKWKPNDRHLELFEEVAFFYQPYSTAKHVRFYRTLSFNMPTKTFWCMWKEYYSLLMKKLLEEHSYFFSEPVGAVRECRIRALLQSSDMAKPTRQLAFEVMKQIRDDLLALQAKLRAVEDRKALLSLSTSD